VAPDGFWAASGARDHVVALWDLQTRQRVASRCLAGEIRACRFLLNGESVVTVDAGGRIALHGLPDLREQTELDTGFPVQCAELSPLGDCLALGCSDGRVRRVAIEGLEKAPIVVTLTQTTRPVRGRLQRWLGGKQFQKAYSCTCPVCRESFDLREGGPGQPASCPRCRRTLRLSWLVRMERDPLGSQLCADKVIR
jgi:hypothetical protein